MDNITHSLFAITLSRTTLGRAGRGTTAALIISSNIPDVDIVAAAGGSVNYLRWHRGPTHGPLGVVALSVVTAAIVWSWQRWSAQRSAKQTSADAVPNRSAMDGVASFPMLVALSAVGVTFHVLMDLPTSYGTRLLSPFDWHWFAVDWMPIIDIYLLMVLVAAIGFGSPSPDTRRRKAAVVLTLMAVNYGMRAAAHHEALALAPRLFGPTLPQPCPGAAPASIVDRWPRAQASFAEREPGRRCLVEMAAIPTFVSPFRWRVVAQMSNAYEIHDVDLLDARFRGTENSSEAFWRLSLRYPNQWTKAVEQAATSNTARAFLGFSRFPAARASVDAHSAATVRWNDMRFVGGVLGLDQPVRGPLPFTVTVRVDPDGRVAEERLGR